MTERDIPGYQRERAYRQGFTSVLTRITLRALRVGAASPRKVARTIAADPSLIIIGIRRFFMYNRAVILRRKFEREGLIVPPLLLMGITSRCNLACSGCYMKDQQDQPGPEMTGDEIRSVVSQAATLGVTGIVILGGEPLLRWKEIIPIARSHPYILFPFFTNGMLINENIAAELSRCTNVIPFISFEGFQSETDARRGRGVYHRLLAACEILDTRIPFFGCSVTVTRDNFEIVLGEPFISMLIRTGARAVAYIQYVPTDPGTEHLVVKPDQRRRLNESIVALNRKFPALFMAAPGDVERFGGCLAAGRGFLYINPSGDLAPCAMAQYSDANLRTVPLNVALRSPFLESIRNNHRMLKPYGHCPLRTDPDWVREISSRRNDA
jgi:MoaA/NifB/PqqE/SkfB family radical SAM enzyme